MKRLLLFASISYYPEGGWHDFKHSADHNWQLKNYYDHIVADWGMIVRASDGLILEHTGTRLGQSFRIENGVWQPYSYVHGEL